MRDYDGYFYVGTTAWMSCHVLGQEDRPAAPDLDDAGRDRGALRGNRGAGDGGPMSGVPERPAVPAGRPGGAGSGRSRWLPQPRRGADRAWQRRADLHALDKRRAGAARGVFHAQRVLQSDRAHHAGPLRARRDGGDRVQPAMAQAPRGEVYRAAFRASGFHRRRSAVR